MHSGPKNHHRFIADRKVFWLFLILFSVVYALQDLPRILGSQQMAMDIWATVEIISVDITAMFILRYIVLYKNIEFNIYIAIILVIVSVVTFVQWTIYGYLRELYGVPVGWATLYMWSLTAGVKEAWFLFTWSALYLSFMINAESQHRALQLERADTLAHQAQLNMLRYQLNPHFLFNTLNSLSALILKKRNKEAENVLMSLSRFLRYSLDTQANQMVSLSEEIDAQKRYLEIESVRFHDRLTVRYDIEKGLKSACVPSLLIQPLVENSIKHAIAKMNRAGTITIRAKSDDNKLVLIVEDNGPGAKNPETLLDIHNNGVGINNTAERLSLLFGKHGSLKVETVETGGFRSIITIPLQFMSKHNENSSG
jgi:two-component system, LytTR family, sensor kinase